MVCICVCVPGVCLCMHAHVHIHVLSCVTVCICVCVCMHVTYIMISITEAAENFHYTNQGDAVKLYDVSDSDEFVATKEAFSLLGLSAELQRSLLRVLAAILHLGNITILQKDDDSQIKVGSNWVHVHKHMLKRVIHKLWYMYMYILVDSLLPFICMFSFEREGYPGEV